MQNSASEFLKPRLIDVHAWFCADRSVYRWRFA